jgi:hypothetical protein
VAGDQVTYSSNSSYCYSAEAETALQEELRLLADIEARYEEERHSLQRSTLPEAVKGRISRQLETVRDSLRGPHVQRLAQLHDELLRRKLYLLETVH